MISQITLQEIKDYLKVEHDHEDNLILQIMESMKFHIKTYTGLTDETMNDKEDLVIALYVLCDEFYNNRGATTNEKNKVREVLDRLLGSHSVNLL